MKESTAKLIRAFRYNNQIHANAMKFTTVAGKEYQSSGMTRKQLAEFHHRRIKTFGSGPIREFMKMHFDKQHAVR